MGWVHNAAGALSSTDKHYDLKVLQRNAAKSAIVLIEGGMRSLYTRLAEWQCASLFGLQR